MANPRARLIVCLGLLGGCFGISLMMLHGWSLPPQAESNFPSPSSGTPLKQEKKVTYMAINTAKETRRRIDGDTLHRYRLVLAAGQFLDAVVEQEGIDVTVLISEPDGRKLPRIDSRSGDRGGEDIHLFARTSGLYQIEVDSGGQKGLYRLRVKPIRTASAKDRLEAEAEEVFHYARALIQERSAEAQDQAIEEFLKAGESWGKLGDKRRQADALERAVELLSREPARAEHMLRLSEQALGLYQAVDDVAGIVRQWNWIAKCHGLLGEDALEIDYYQKALQFAREWGDKTGEAAALKNSAEAWFNRGELLKALEAYEESRRYWRELGMRNHEVETMVQIGLIYFSLGDASKSLVSYQQAYRLLGPGGDISLRAKFETRIAESLEKLGRWDEALAHARLALELRRADNDGRGEGVVLAGMSLSYQGLGDFRRAREAQEQALSIFHRWGTARDVTVGSLNFGILLLRSGDVLQSLPVLEQALTDARKQGLRDVEAVTLHALARARLRNPIMAISYAEQAILIMESIRRDAVREDLKAMYLEAQRGCYELLVNLLIANPPSYTPEERIARAFEVSEQRKARNLLDSLTTPRPPLSPELAVVRQSLRKDIEHQEVEIERRRQLRLPWKDQQKILAQLVERRSNLDANSQVQGIKLSAPALISLKDAQSLLTDDTLLLVYHLGDQRSLLFLVDSDGVEVHALPPERKIEASARRFHELLAESQIPKNAKLAAIVAEDLGRMLLGPVVGQLEKKRLAVVPDGALHYVPFGDLAVSSSSRLFETHEVVSLPSVSVLAAIREREGRRADPPGFLVAFAAPVFREKQYKDLPNSQHEAEVIRDLIPTGARSVVKLGYEATKDAAVSGLLSRFKVVHLAAHGTIDTEHPELSGIVLTQKNRKGVSLDGYLRVHDIWALHIPADLVVLSACKTALGKEMRAEGVVGLTQSFFHAGSASVLVSLWNVDDESTPEFMRVFYTSMYVRHRSPAASLREAQIWMSQQKRWQSPYYWAGFVLQGEWR